VKTKTQGRRLIEDLKKRPMTYRAMLQASESCSPWRRVKESLLPGEDVITATNAQGWKVWRVVSLKK